MPDSERYKLAIHWFRRDLRITDNTALSAAVHSAAAVLPTYIISRWSGSHLWTGQKRQQFLCECLKSLSNNIKSIDGNLVFRQGEAVDELLTLAKETGADAIFFNRDPDPFGQDIEKKLAEAAEKAGVAIRSFQDAAMSERDEILTNQDSVYRVFTPYSKKWHAKEKALPIKKAAALNTPKKIKSLDPPTLKTWGQQQAEYSILKGGEKAARERLKKALPRISNYDNSRDIPSIAGTSRLSQDLRFGTISVRQIHAQIRSSKVHQFSTENHPSHKYLNELAWRDFYFQILWHYPEVLTLEFNPVWRGLPWDEPNEQFKRWKTGETGFPIVDAGIRQLLTTGFMHNRVRMIVAMFLTKDLHIDWRLGEQFFMQHLLDGEIASNNGGWQWSAGTGADAAPYFRIQNPWTQTKRYDPQGEYIKKWIPELTNTENKKLFSQPTPGTSLAKGYPKPCVDHNTERKRTLEIFKKHRDAAL